jgi:ribosomal protein S18 acetylase RimI-like enzyme
MSSSDIAPAISLTDTAEWGLTESDFRFMINLEPNGCFVVYDRRKLIGILTTIQFDHYGWIGNVIVDSSYRGRNIGSDLVLHAIQFLQKRGVRTIGLYSYLDVVPFYDQLGFERDERFIFLVGSGCQSDRSRNILPMRDLDFEKALALDSRCFGFSREKLLRPIFLGSKELCYTIYEEDELIGFIMGGKYSKTAEIGPLICRSQQKAADLLSILLRHFINLDVYIGIPEKKSEILQLLNELGFRESFKVLRMYYGYKPQVNDCIVAVESLERG